MSEATRLSVEPDVPLRPGAVECKNGHGNDPYPEDGRCVECGIFLPDNPHILTSEKAAEYRHNQVEGGRSREEIAKAILEDEGIPWDKATEGLRQLSLQFAKSKNTKTLELILQQIGVLKAKPKPGEEETELVYELSLTAGSIDSLQRSLADLSDITAR